MNRGCLKGHFEPLALPVTIHSFLPFIFSPYILKLMPHFCQAAAFSRWTNMMKLMVAVCNLANMAKNYLPFTFN